MTDDEESALRKELERLRELLFLLYDEISERDGKYRLMMRISQRAFLMVHRWAQEEHEAGRWPTYIPPPKRRR